jgi:hypothetical protein
MHMIIAPYIALCKPKYGVLFSTLLVSFNLFFLRFLEVLAYRFFSIS